MNACSTRFPIRNAALAVLILSSCSSPSKPIADGDDFPHLEELVVLTRNAPTTYYIEREDDAAGPEHDLATEFANELGVPVRFEVIESVEGILQALQEGRAHLAAAGLTVTEARAQQFLLGPAYQTVEEEVICHRSLSVSEPQDLLGKRLGVIADGSYIDSLKRMRQDLPELEWSEVGDESTERLLHWVNDKRLDCTIADSNIVAIERRLLPRLRQAFPLSEQRSIAWLIAPSSSFLKPRVDAWFADIERNGRLDKVLERYFGFVEDFDPYDLQVFYDRIEGRLPRFRSLFEEAAQTAQLPWLLLAAVAYQESHWDPSAESPTGVRGIMMLTQRTAEGLGVRDRLDPAQSIDGGARYLRQRIDRLPPFIPEPDRLWMALASYNMGHAHLQDARRLAIELDLNPNSWSGIKEVLPRLSQRRYYRGLRHGYARGNQALAFVDRVRNYHDLLEQKLE